MPNEIMTLQGYEVRLQMYREQVVGGWLGMGRTLVQAKDSGVVPHGQWVSWAEAHACMSIRDVQRVMQLAREYDAGSSIARLDMTKAVQLLRLPAEERESFAEANNAEERTTRELKAAIDARLKVQESMKKALIAAEEQKKRMIIQAGEVQHQLQIAQARAKTLDAQLNEMVNNPPEPEVRTVQVVPEDYEEIKARDLTAAARIREAEDFADQQEQIVRELRMQISEAGAGDKPDLGRDFFRVAGEMIGVINGMLMRSDLNECMSAADISAMGSWIGNLSTQLGTLKNRLRKPISVGVSANVR